MELREFWRVLSRQWLAALIGFLVCAVVVGYAAFSPADQFRASSTVSVEPANLASGTSGNVDVVNFLMPALQAQVETTGFDQKVRGTLPADIRGARYTVSSTVTSGTGLLVITAESSNRNAVARVANAYASTLTSSPSSGLKIRVLAPAQTPNHPQGPHRLVILVSGLVLAVIVAVLAALIAHAAARRRSRGEEIREQFGLTVLGEIPPIRRLRASTIVHLFNRVDDPAVEAIVDLRTNVELAVVRNHVPAVCVTSYGVGAGKSLVSGALAYAMASVGHQVMLVEGDLRRPSLAPALGLPASRGELDGGGVAVPVVARPGYAFRFLSADDVRETPGLGPEQRVGRHPADMVATVMPHLLSDTAAAGLAIVDAPPIMAAETKLIISLTRWAVVVVDAHRRDALDDLEETVTQVRDAGGEVLGIVLNRARIGRAQRRANAYGTGPVIQQRRTPARGEQRPEDRPVRAGD